MKARTARSSPSCSAAGGRPARRSTRSSKNTEARADWTKIKAIQSARMKHDDHGQGMEPDGPGVKRPKMIPGVTLQGDGHHRLRRKERLAGMPVMGKKEPGRFADDRRRGGPVGTWKGPVAEGEGEQGQSCSEKGQDRGTDAWSSASR